jgi:FkbM family methyltransferase
MTESPFISYAQNGEDVMLWRALRDQTPGFYIDIGASDPELLSVTRAFYDRGWRGVDVEPLPEQAVKLRQARPENVVVEAAVADAPGQAIFHRVYLAAQTGLSTLDPVVAAQSGGRVESLEVAVTTLAALCREHVRGEVHFLKIDAEGAEAAVLRGADFVAFRPWVVVVEAVQPNTGEPAGAECGAIMAGAGYVPVWFDGLNRFYLAQERHAALARHFRAQPNPFDHYITADRALADVRLERILELEAPLTPHPTAQPVAAAPRPRSVLFAWWRLARPVLRPLLWRLRTFLTGPLRDEIAAVRDEQAAIRSLLTAALERERKR